MVLLSTAYFAPISYYILIANNIDVILEKHENFNRQSYRNRCRIYSANGLQDLVVPIVKNKSEKTKITEVQISYDTLWQKQHYKAIEAAYRNSPFYEFYIDDLKIFFDKPYTHLYQMNMEILQKICQLIKLPLSIEESTVYQNTTENLSDYRDIIHPKKEHKIKTPTYWQVFASKFGFKHDLSILDLLFNMGPAVLPNLVDG
jgi:hypothetical protein